MKKIIILMLLIPNIVLGETIYTEYKPFLLNTNIYLEETDILKRKEEIVYNTYKEELEEKYLSLDDPLSKEYQIDYNDYNYIYTNSLENSKYSESFQTKCLNESYSPKSLTISNFNDNFKITEVQVSSSKLKGVGIGITSFKGFMSSIANDKIDESPNELNKESKISLNFFKNIEIDDLKIKLYLPKQDLNTFSFKITLNNGTELTSEVNLNINEDNIITINFDNDYYKFLEDYNFTTLNTCISYYGLKIPLYKHSKLNIIPLNNYIPLNDTELFLKDDYKTIYNYFKREKIILSDAFTLSEKNFDFNNYIVSTTIPINDLNIIHNINYEQEGTYNVDIYYQNQLLISKKIEYLKKTIDEVKVEKTQETKTTNKIINTTQPTTKKVRKKITTKKNTQINKVTTNSVKKMNNKLVSNVKTNKYQKTILITVILFLIIILIIFEIILLYVNKKYY